MKRIYLIDYLKAISIIMVIITHYEWEDKTTPFFTLIIAMAVPIFMLLTSYNFSMSFERKADGTFLGLYDRKLVMPRIVRFTVPFLIIYMVEVVMYAVRGQSFSFQELIYHLIEGGFGPGSYYYPILIQLLFLFPLIYFMIKRLSWIGVAVVGLVNLAYEYYVQYSEMELETYRLLIPRYLMFLAMGCYMYFHLQERVQIEEILAKAECMPGKERAKAECMSGKECAKADRVSVKIRRKYPLPIWTLLPAFGIGLYFILWVFQFENQPELEIFCFWTRTSMLTAFYIFPVIYLLMRFGKNGKIPGIVGTIITEIGKSSYHIFLVQMMYFEFFDDILFPAEPAVPVTIGNIIVCLTAGYGFYLLETHIHKKTSGALQPVRV